MERTHSPAKLAPVRYPQVGVILCVVAGGFLGTLARYFSGEYSPFGNDLIGTFWTNVVGASLLGALFMGLDHANHGRRRNQPIRHFLGTGLLGGFTTYSALAVQTALLVEAGNTAQAMTYSVGTIVAGMAAAVAGMLVVRSLMSIQRERATV